MADRDQQHRPARTDETGEEAPEATTDVDVEKVDDLLDDIDAVLEENAEEFVKNYVQKGGE